MRKILLNLAITLDGFIEGPNGEYDWCLTDQDYGMEEFTGRTDMILFGRKSYELLMATEPNAWNSPKRVVFSKTLTEMDGALVLNGDLLNNITRLKQEPGKDIWLFGGALLTNSLLELGLVDELHLSVHPILLGSGKSLFENNKKKIDLHLKESRQYSSGLVQLIYEIR